MNLSQKLVKTRTEHQCWGCAKTFPAGSTMWSVAGINDGDFYHCYWCETCTKVLDGLADCMNIGRKKMALIWVILSKDSKKNTIE